MARVRDRGAAAITADIEAWWRQKRAAAEAEVAKAEAMPIDEAEEEAWRQWSERCSSEINRMHDEYDATFRRDVLRRAKAAGVDPEQFADLTECDLYLQSIK
jgi:hypothetical protein